MRIEIQPNADLEDLSAQAKACFERLSAGSPRSAEAADAAVRMLETHMRAAKYDDIPEDVLALEAATPRLGALVAARLLSGMKDACARRETPASVAAECARQGWRILASLERQSATSLSLTNDAFQKDLSICLGTAFPCVAQVVELHSGIPLRLFSTGTVAERLNLIARVARQRRTKPYYEIHTHTPMLDGFTEAGWDRCYHMIAKLMRQDPDCLGIVGGSWFYDPALPAISPRLAYLRDVPASGGAFFVRRGATEMDAALATATSESRRKLYEAGTYVPTGYVMIWQRQDLIAWSERNEQGRGRNA